MAQVNLRRSIGEVLHSAVDAEMLSGPLASLFMKPAEGYE